MKGSVYRRASGKWEYRFDLGPDPMTGKRRMATQGGFPTEKEAARALRSAIAGHEGGRQVGRTRKTVADFLEEWHVAVRPSLRETTWVNYRDYLDAYVLPYIGRTRLQDLTPVRLNLLYGKLLRAGRVRGGGGLAPKTVRNVHLMLHRALRDAHRWDYLPRNVASDADPPRIVRHEPEVWTPAQLRTFVDHVSRDRFAALWLLAATTGLRRGELAGLRVQDVDLAAGRVTPRRPRVVADGRAVVSEPKTATGFRSMALDPVTWRALRGYVWSWSEERRVLGQDTRLLFVHVDGTPLHPDTITERFRKHAAAAGLPRIRLHDVRHSYATAALKARVPPKVVSERLGHSSVAFTMQVYAHVIPGMDEDAAQVVADLILGPRGTVGEPDAH